ncbi:hypothetical protein BVRB_9g211800 isoform B [Beta vulgaris subsp. vulgaris]|nr:hypothetical protein BVRB_9g211800 isoform B [Beta vulgaris subsp. vulgaris]
MNAGKTAIESSYITKVLSYKWSAKWKAHVDMSNFCSTQIAYSLVQEQDLAQPSDDRISFIGLLADHRFCVCRHILSREERTTYSPMQVIFGSGKVPEQDILSIIDVTSGKMGRIIGKRGASIQYI